MQDRLAQIQLTNKSYTGKARNTDTANTTKATQERLETQIQLTQQKLRERRNTDTANKTKERLEQIQLTQQKA